jgi:DNA-binding SARP family transcriptional activator/tetratricopeptide (TPR) repeat protein
LVLGLDPTGRGVRKRTEGREAASGPEKALATVGKAAAKVSELHPARAKERGRLEVRLFGHLEVALDGVPLHLATPRKSLQVLAYLLLHRGGAVSREYLAFLLHPDDEEGSARAKLRATLSELAKILPQPSDRYVTIDTDKLAWNPDADLWLDVDAFEAASRDGRRLGEATDLYRGDLLPEIYDEWLDVIRERYRNAYLRCLTERVSELRRGANLALAIETARKVLAIDPWREDVVRRIIAMRYEAGDRAGALREYAEFAKRLRAEMGTEPMAETLSAAERVKRDEAPADEAGESDRVTVADGSSILPFVGRHDEMERLLETWSRVARGRGACVFVGGESGIGKSRIALEFAHAVEDRGGRVLVGATGSPENVPYECIVDALRSALPLVASLKPSIALGSVATLIPEIHARVALPDIPRLDPESERIRLFESLFRCLADLATARPLLLVLEDMHSAQAATIDFLQIALRRISAVPVMIVITYRDEETPRLHALHRLRREARAAAAAHSIWLSRFSVAEVEELRATLPDIGNRPAETLIAASQGNPLFLTQLVVDVREGEPAVAPASLQEVVARRVERLSEHARTAAEIAACIGDRFSRDAVREVSAWDESAVTDALDELLDRRIIREAGGRSFLEYSFAHQLMHEAIAQTVPPKQAAVRRRRVARVMEELYPERVSELSASLAAHYECAHDVPNAARCYLEAVRRSISIGALAEARMLCDRALALDLEPRARAGLLLESVTIESRRASRESRQAALQALERIDSELGDPAIHRAAILQRIEFAVTTGDRVEHERAVRALRDCVPDEDARWSAELHLAEGRLAFTEGDLARAFAHGKAALAQGRAANDETAARALCFLAQVEAHRGHLKLADELFDEAAQVAARAEDPVLEQLALSSGWVIAYQRRDILRCRSLSERCLELAVKLGDRPAEAQGHGRLGVTLAAAGTEVVDARRHFAEAGRIYDESGNLAGTAAQLMNQALLENRIGFFDRAIDATKKAVYLFERAGDARGRVGALANLVFLYACTRQVPEARESAKTARDLARRFGFRFLEASVLENLAVAEAVAGDYAQAIEIAESSLELRAGSESEVWSSKTLADLAIWYGALGNLPAARDKVGRLLADEDAIMRATDWPSYCYWAAAQIFHLDGESAKATRARESARRLMQTTAEQLEAEDREYFLALPWHVDLMQAVTKNLWPNPPR